MLDSNATDVVSPVATTSWNNVDAFPLRFNSKLAAALLVLSSTL